MSRNVGQPRYPQGPLQKQFCRWPWAICPLVIVKICNSGRDCFKFVTSMLDSQFHLFNWNVSFPIAFRVKSWGQFMPDVGFLTPWLYGLVCSLKLWASITGNLVRRSTVYLIIVLEALHNIFCFGTFELVYLNGPTGPIHNYKKVNFLAIDEDLFS